VFAKVNPNLSPPNQFPGPASPAYAQPAMKTGTPAVRVLDQFADAGCDEDRNRDLRLVTSAFGMKTDYVAGTFTQILGQAPHRILIKRTFGRQGSSPVQRTGDTSPPSHHQITTCPRVIDKKTTGTEKKAACTGSDEQTVETVYMSKKLDDSTSRIGRMIDASMCSGHTRDQV